MVAEILADFSDVAQTPHPVFGMMPNNSLEPTPVGRCSLRFDIIVPAWLSFGR